MLIPPRNFVPITKSMDLKMFRNLFDCHTIIHQMLQLYLSYLQSLPDILFLYRIPIWFSIIIAFIYTEIKVITYAICSFADGVIFFCLRQKRSGCVCRKSNCPATLGVTIKGGLSYGYKITELHTACRTDCGTNHEKSPELGWLFKYGI